MSCIPSLRPIQNKYVSTGNILPVLRERVEAPGCRRVREIGRHGAYVVLQQIGRGPETVVQEAYDRNHERYVAIKVVRQKYRNDRERLARRWAAARTMSRLSHPNLLKIHEIDERRGWIVSERMQVSLFNRLKHHRLHPDEVREVLLQALAGLDCLHQHGIIHGDIKIENLLSDTDGRIKVAEPTGLSMCPLVSPAMGRRHIAPELLMPEKFGPVGCSSDLYALGFAMLELLLRNDLARNCSGVTPGEGRSDEWLAWHRNPVMMLPPVQDLVQGIPKDLAIAIEGMIAKRVRERFATAEQVSRALLRAREACGRCSRL